MLPINPNVNYKHFDAKSGVTFSFKYLTKGKEDEFMKFIDDSEKAVKPFMSEARKQITVETKGEKFKKGELEQKVRARAAELAQAAAGENSDYTNEVRKLIDMFLVGWEWDIKDIDLPEFPKKPSEFFVIGDLFEMGNLVSSLIPTLTGFGHDTVKN
jgi:hypothetical protein